MDWVLQRALMGKAPPGWEWVGPEAWRLCALYHPWLSRLFLLVQWAIVAAGWAVKLLMYLPVIVFVGWWIAVGVAVAALLALLVVRRLLVAVIATALVTHWLHWVQTSEEQSTTVGPLTPECSVARQG